jgi:superfamily I DNA/RNA helicase
VQRWEWRINKDAQRIKDIDERKRYITQETNIIRGKLDFLHDCLIQWQSRCNTIIDILKVIKEYISATNNCIRLSSIHRAKGLEENRVFIIDFDMLPLTRTDQKPWEETQEINLKYVAVTRAKEELFLVSSPKTASQSEEDTGTLFDELFD